MAEQRLSCSEYDDTVLLEKFIQWRTFCAAECDDFATSIMRWNALINPNDAVSEIEGCLHSFESLFDIVQLRWDDGQWRAHGFHILNKNTSKEHTPFYRGRWFTKVSFEWGNNPKGSHLWRDGFLKTVLKAIVLEGPSDNAIAHRLNCDRQYVANVRRTVEPILARMGRSLPACSCSREYGHGGWCIGIKKSCVICKVYNLCQRCGKYTWA